MIIYLHRADARTCAESEASAARLEAQGWVRCSAAYHRALWRIADAQVLAVQARERETAPLGRGTVYLVKGRTMP
jgi:hypothetical protein